MGGFVRHGRVAAFGSSVCALIAASCGAASRIDDLAPRDESWLTADVGCAYDSFECNPAINDVPGQLRAMRDRGAPLGFHRGVLAAPSRSHHWQSIQRMPGAYSNHLVITRSTALAADADVGVVQLASRATSGGALQSNRL